MKGHDTYDTIRKYKIHLCVCAVCVYLGPAADRTPDSLITTAFHRTYSENYFILNEKEFK